MQRRPVSVPAPQVLEEQQTPTHLLHRVAALDGAGVARTVGDRKEGESEQSGNSDTREHGEDE